MGRDWLDNRYSITRSGRHIDHGDNIPIGVGRRVDGAPSTAHIVVAGGMLHAACPVAIHLNGAKVKAVLALAALGGAIACVVCLAEPSAVLKLLELLLGNWSDGRGVSQS